jgi:hypothetical protein
MLQRPLGRGLALVHTVPRKRTRLTWDTEIADELSLTLVSPARTARRDAGNARPS